jgi:uncharacterized protein (TIGR03118 family)
MGNSTRFKQALLATAVAAGALCIGVSQAEAYYVQTNLVSDINGLAALYDPALVNPWGMSFSPVSPVWVSDQGTNFATLYAVPNLTSIPTKTMPTDTNGNIAIPTTMTGPQGPTGQVNNTNTSSFLIPVNVGTTTFAHFIFANLNGTISAWAQGQTPAAIEATTAGALYTGLAINAAQTQLYAANDSSTGSINVFNSAFLQISLGANAFIDPNLPAGYVPFNVQDIGGKVYVTYAPAGHAAQTGATAGMGIVDVYDESGDLLQRLITGGQLAAPWGIALAPASGFGQFSGDLLVGNFSYVDSGINAFNPTTGAFEGSIPIDVGAGNTAGGLWALEFGIGGSNANPDTLFFNDGINGETDGLFGAITTPEPSGLTLLAAGLVFLGIWRGGSRRQA